MPLAKVLEDAWGRVADILFPRYCYGCDRFLGNTDNRYLCLACWRKIPLIRDEVCLHCGMPLGPAIPQQTTCDWCRTQQFAFDEVRGAGLYRGSLRDLLLAFKFRGLMQIAEPLAAMIAWQLDRIPFSQMPDFIVPVPLSEKSYAQRGYNQAELLANSLTFC